MLGVNLSTLGVLGCYPVILLSRDCLLGVISDTMGVLLENPLGPFLGHGLLGILDLVFWVMLGKGKMVFFPW